MKRHLLPVIITASVILLFVYACFILNHSKSSTSDSRHPTEVLSAKPENVPVPPGLAATIASREYHISYDRTRHKLQSPNRKHNLRTYYGPGKVTIHNRIDSSGHNFSLTLINEGLLADGRMIDQPDPAAKPEVTENTLRMRHAKFTEEFINNENGVRQNFIVHAAPEGTKELAVQLTARGLQIQGGGENELLFFDQNNKTTPRLIYRDLKCWDANSRPLIAHMTGRGQRIQIAVDVRDAAYPVTIDPIVVNGSPANAHALLEQDQADAWLGFSVASAGDVNADGYSDVLAGAPHYDNGEDNEGAAFLYYGSANGLNTAPAVLESNQVNAELGYSVASAGDVNADGFSDIAIGAPFYDNGQANEGVVFVHLGSPNGIKPVPAAVLEGNQSGAQLGISVALAGDINGDSYSDLIAGANEFDQGQLNEGAAFVFYGSKTGINANQVNILEMNQSISGMGSSVAGAGDVNADGFGDVLVGAPFYDQGEFNEGAAFVYLGSVNGVIPAPTLLQGNQADAHLGASLASAGDVNGDNFSDIIVGAPHYDKSYPDQGLVRIYLGSANGVKTNTPITLAGQQTQEEFGRSVACAGDVQGDGYADVLVAARMQGKNLLNEGIVMLFSGIQTGIGKKPLSVFISGQTNAYLGQSLASAGDVNGDGFSDMLVGAHLYDHGENNEGAIMVWHGGASGPDTAAASALHCIQPESQFGYAVSGAGDIDGDGYEDIIVGAPRYDNGQTDEGAAFLFKGTPHGISKTPGNTLEADQADAGFGTSVSTAGDINGDGYSDTVVGCYTFDNGQTDEGHVFIYHGGPSGLTAGVSTTLAFQQSGTQFGASVASAGDVNADGYGDVIVGAPYYDGGQSNEGLVFVFYGSPTGLSINNKTLLEHNQADSHFGNAVAGAGDINGDGYDDIIAAAMDYDNGQSDEGVVFVHYGSSGGIDLNSVMLLEHNVINEEFGFSVSGAGDINRDGYADIIVGVIKYSDGQANEGAAFMYYGSNTGLGKLSVFQANQAEARFGSSVSSAGDVNGDGFGDVVVGAPYYDFGQNDEGLVYTLLGTSSGLIWLGSKQLEINKTNAHLGTSVSSAGDVNGDGFDDIIIGASEYVNGQSSEGIAIIYYGSNTGISDLGATKIESNSAYAYLGSSVSGAGDVDGDGYSDVIVGANLMTGNLLEEGKVFVFKGSHAGIIQTPAFSLEGGQQGANLGTSVSSAGDVNGDGYSDIIVGIPHFNALNGPDAGGVKVFYGNSTKDGIQNNTRLYNTNGAILDHSQFSQSGFKAGLFAKSFIGTNQGKLVWETQGQGIPFIKAGTAPNQTITVSTEYIGISFAYSALAGTGAELKNNISKSGLTTKVRVRVKYSPALAITGQVYGPWRYLQPQLTGSFYAPVPEEQVETQTKKLENSEVLTQVRIFPNPVSDKLGIETADAGNVRAVKLVNAYGAAVYQSSKAEREIDVSRLAEGVYILTLQKADGTHSTHRVLIKK